MSNKTPIDNNQNLVQDDTVQDNQGKIDISNQMEDIKEKSNKVWLIYVITAAVGLMIVFFACLIGGIFSPEKAGRELIIIMDAFFVAGVLLMGVGALGWVSNQGGFDMLGFGFKQMLRIFNPVSKLEKKRQTFYEYKQEKSKKVVRIGHTLIVGAGFFAVSLIMLLFFKVL